MEKNKNAPSGCLKKNSSFAVNVLLKRTSELLLKLTENVYD